MRGTYRLELHAKHLKYVTDSVHFRYVYKTLRVTVTSASVSHELQVCKAARRAFAGGADVPKNAGCSRSSRATMPKCTKILKKVIHASIGECEFLS